MYSSHPVKTLRQMQCVDVSVCLSEICEIVCANKLCMLFHLFSWCLCMCIILILSDDLSFLCVR